MRQLIYVFLIDVIMASKAYMGGYMVVVPLGILLILRLFIPSVESATSTFAVVNEGPNAVKQEIIELLDDIGKVKTYSTVDKLTRKIQGIGSVEGLYWDTEARQYVSILKHTAEKNRYFSLSASAVRQVLKKEYYPDMPRATAFSHEIPAEISEIRKRISPVATIGGAIFIVFLVMVDAYLIGMAMVNDKTQGTIFAIRVSPVSKKDYFLGRCILPLLILLIYAYLSLLFLGLTHINILQMYFVICFSYSVTLLFGLLIGALGKNEVEAIAYGKIMMTVLSLSMLGTLLLPENWLWIVWWSPVYWVFDLIRGVFTETASWGGIIWKSVVLVGITGFYFLVTRKRIINGLS